MAETLHLIPSELIEATGAHRRSRQLQWLADAGIPAAVGMDGKVKVLRDAYRAKMMPGGMVRTRTKTEPRLDLLKRSA